MFESLQEMVNEAESTQKSLAEVVIATEMETSNLSLAEVREKMEKRLHVNEAKRSRGVGSPHKVDQWN